MSLATLEELQARLKQTISSAQEARAQACLDDVSVLVLDAGDADWTADTVPDVAKTVTLMAAKRAFLNPEGLSSEALGDYTKRRATPDVYLTDVERRLVRKAAGVAGVGTLDLEGYVPVAEDFDIYGEDESL